MGGRARAGNSRLSISPELSALRPRAPALGCELNLHADEGIALRTDPTLAPPTKAGAHSAETAEAIPTTSIALVLTIPTEMRPSVGRVGQKGGMGAAEYGFRWF